MSQTWSAGHDGARSRVVNVLTDGLALAASPTFAGMALLAGGSGRTDVLCSATATSPLSGMVAMFLLMAALHAAPWLRLLLHWSGIGERGASEASSHRWNEGQLR